MLRSFCSWSKSAGRLMLENKDEDEGRELGALIRSSNCSLIQTMHTSLHPIRSPWSRRSAAVTALTFSLYRRSSSSAVSSRSSRSPRMATPSRASMHSIPVMPPLWSAHVGLGRETCEQPGLGAVVRFGNSITVRRRSAAPSSWTITADLFLHVLSTNHKWRLV